MLKDVYDYLLNNHMTSLNTKSDILDFIRDFKKEPKNYYIDFHKIYFSDKYTDNEVVWVYFSLSDGFYYPIGYSLPLREKTHEDLPYLETTLKYCKDIFELMEYKTIDLANNDN